MNLKIDSLLNIINKFVVMKIGLIIFLVALTIVNAGPPHNHTIIITYTDGFRQSCVVCHHAKACVVCVYSYVSVVSVISVVNLIGIDVIKIFICIFAITYFCVIGIASIDKRRSRRRTRFTSYNPVVPNNESVHVSTQRAFDSVHTDHPTFSIPPYERTPGEYVPPLTEIPMEGAVSSVFDGVELEIICS